MPTSRARTNQQSLHAQLAHDKQPCEIARARQGQEEKAAGKSRRRHPLFLPQCAYLRQAGEVRAKRTSRLLSIASASTGRLICHNGSRVAPALYPAFSHINDPRALLLCARFLPTQKVALLREHRRSYPRGGMKGFRVSDTTTEVCYPPNLGWLREPKRSQKRSSAVAELRMSL